MATFYVLLGLGCSLLAVWNIKKFGDNLAKEYQDHHHH